MTPAALPTAIRKRIAVTGDCWLWTGASCHGVPMLGSSVVKRQIWHELTGEMLHQLEAVFAECDSFMGRHPRRRLTQPPHHHRRREL